MTPSPLKAVLIDADDTLWENNVFFLQSLEWLYTIGRRYGFTHRAVTTIMNRWERHHIALKGFGYDSYEASLVAAVRQIAQHSPEGQRDHAGIHQRALHWTHFLRNHPMVLLPGVAETMPIVCGGFPTIIVTKGNQDDQMAKVIRSGFLSIVKAVEVVPHKNPADYRRVLEKHDLQPGDVIMIGNSPRSDINQAKRAGIRTIYVPHRNTWVLEMEPISPDIPETIHVPDFAGIRSVLGLS